MDKISAVLARWDAEFEPPVIDWETTTLDEALEKYLSDPEMLQLDRLFVRLDLPQPLGDLFRQIFDLAVSIDDETEYNSAADVLSYKWFGHVYHRLVNVGPFQTGIGI